MPFFDRLSFGGKRRLPAVLQTESSECGLACLAMIANYYGNHTDLRTLRERFPASLKGTTLARLIEIALDISLTSRPIKLSIDELGQLRLPCILHWNLNHFVVLKEVTKNGVVVHDPAFGTRRLPLDAVSSAFTGVALELWPDSNFQEKRPAPPIKIRQVIGTVVGISRSTGQILVLAFALELFGLMNPLLLQWVLDDVIVAADREFLNILIIGFGLLLLAQRLTSATRTWALMYLGATFGVQWRANVFTHLLSLPVKYFERRRLGDVSYRFNATDDIQRTLTSTFMSAALDGVMSIITLFMIFMYSPKLATIVVFSITLYIIGRWLRYTPLREATEQQIIHTERQQSHLLETLRGVKTIKLFNRQVERRSAWLTLLVDQFNSGTRVQRMQLVFQQLNELLFGIEGLAVIWLGARMVMDGSFTVGVLIAFLTYKGQFEVRVGTLVDRYFELRMLRLQGERVADIVLTRPEALRRSEHVNAIIDGAPVIELEKLTFSYDRDDRQILNDISLKIHAGESVAIIGPSGCGKTTLLNIMLGVLEPISGAVKVSGIDVVRHGAVAIREIVGTVLQDDVLFAGTLAENISFFDPSVDQLWVEQCARMASIHDDIVSMPMGYGTLTGDMGTVLSGGQKQRVLLARALYKRPSILFLDEATSHLDLNREREVNAVISKLNITRIIIAHRTETISSADRLLELKDGKLLECISASNDPESYTQDWASHVQS